MKENRELFTLSDEEMAIVNSIAERKGIVRFLDPKTHIGFDIFREDVDEPIDGATQIGGEYYWAHVLLYDSNADVDRFSAVKSVAVCRILAYRGVEMVGI